MKKITVCGFVGATGVEILNLTKSLSTIPAKQGWDFFMKRIEFFFSKILNTKERVCYNTNTKAKNPSYLYM